MEFGALQSSPWSFFLYLDSYHDLMQSCGFIYGSLMQVTLGWKCLDPVAYISIFIHTFIILYNKYFLAANDYKALLCVLSQ